jgi:hypothetical protein
MRSALTACALPPRDVRACGSRAIDLSPYGHTQRISKDWVIRGRIYAKLALVGDDFFLRIRGAFAPLLAASRFIAFVASRQ